MNRRELLWHSVETGYMDLRLTGRDNHIGPIEHLRQYFTRDLGKCRSVWVANEIRRNRWPDRLLIRMQMKFSTSPAPDNASVWMN